MMRTLLGKKIPVSRWALAVGLSSSLLALGAVSAQDVTNPTTAQAPETAASERVVVTGSNIPTSEEVGEAPVDTIDQAARDRTGQEDIESELIRANPAVSSGNNNVGQNNASTNTGATFGGAAVTIHGLPTLVLLDGRRLTDASAEAAGGIAFSDVNLFPSALVKRIEVLKDGASPIYGSEAIGGVINVILDQDFTGFDFATRYGFTEKSDIHDERYSGIIGLGDDKTHLVLGAEYVEQDPIYNRDRDFSSSYFATTTFGGVTRFNGGLFTLAPALNSPNDVVPAGSVPLPTAGTNPLPGVYASNPNARFGFNLSNATTITTDQNRLNVFASGDRQLLGDHVVAFTDFLYASSYAQSYLNAQPLSNGFGVEIPFGAPYNPFNQTINAANQGTVTVNNRFTALPRVYRDDINFYRVVAGLKGEIIKDYNYEVAFNSSRDQTTFTNPNLVVLSDVDDAVKGGYDAAGNQVPATFSADGKTLLTPAGNYSVVRGNLQPALDFFARNNPAASLQNIGGTEIALLQSKFSGVDGKVTGFPFTLPAGPFGFAAGGEYRHENLKSVTSNDIFVDSASPADIDVGRDEFAVFAEISVPVIGPDMKIPGIYSLDLDGAVRFENYSDAGGDTVGKAGFVLRPIKDVAFRGTYSASFIAPTLFDTSGPESIGSTSSITLTAATGSEQGNGEAGSNPDLGTSRADTYTLGVVVSPHWVEGLTMNVDFFHVEQKSLIGVIGDSTIIPSVDALGAASPFASLVHLGSFTGPTGTYLPTTQPGHFLAGNLPEYFVTSNEINGGGQRIGGLDFGIHYTHDFGRFGQASAGCDGTYYLQFKTQTLPGTEFYNVIGFYTGGAELGSTTGSEIAQYHLTPELEYKWGGATVSALGNYTPRVRDAASVSLDPTPGLGGINPDKNDSNSIVAATGGADHLAVIRDYFTIDLLASYEFGLKKPDMAEPMAPAKEGKDAKGGKDTKSSAMMAKEMITNHLLDGLKISFGVDNVTNARPPLISDSPDATATDAGIYDPYQRRYYIVVEKKF